MPQPKGHEPFTRIWTVNYKVIVQSGAIAAGTFLSRPRSIVFGTKAEADAAHDSLVAQSQVVAGYPAPGTVQSVLQENYFNSRAFLLTFVNEHVAFVRVSV